MGRSREHTDGELYDGAMRAHQIFERDLHRYGEGHPRVREAERRRDTMVERYLGSEPKSFVKS